MIPPVPVCRHSSMRAAIFSSQGRRSASVSGILARILAMFAAGCRSSPSSNGQPSRAATALPMVVLPDPLTPINTRTRGGRAGAATSVAGCAAAVSFFPGIGRLLLRSTLGAFVRQWQPCAAVALQQDVRFRRAAAARPVEAHAFAGRLPPVQERLNRTPARFDVIGALEKRGIADQAVVDQRFITRRR